MDPNTTLVLIGVLAMLVVGGVATALFGGFGSSTRQRLKMDDGAGRGFGKRVSREQSVQELANERLSELNQSQRVSLRLRMTQAGLSMTPAQFIITFQVIGLIFGGGGYYLSAQPFVGLGVALVVAFAGPRWYLARRIDKRQLKFTGYFPGALDILVRGVKSGLPVSEGLRIVANEIPDPVAGEFRLLVDSSAVGVSLDDALKRMAERMPTQDVAFFRTVLTIQKQTGGNLAESLGNLSDTLRERYKLKLKIRALTAEARVSAIILGCLPLVVAGAVYLLRPEYIELLFTDERGETMLIGAGVWMTLGVLTLRSMVNFKI